MDRLVLETDAPYFRPQYAGVLPEDNLRFCHPLQVVAVAAQIAEVKDLTLEDVLSACRENVGRVYRIPVPGDRMEAVAAVENILDDVIGNVIDDNIIKTRIKQRELKRLSDMHGGGDTKKLKTVVDHLVKEPFTLDRPGYKVSTEIGGVLSSEEDSVSVVTRQILEQLVSQVAGSYCQQVRCFVSGIFIS